MALWTCPAFPPAPPENEDGGWEGGMGNGLMTAPLVAVPGSTGDVRESPGKGKGPLGFLRCTRPSLLMSMLTVATVSLTRGSKASEVLLVENDGLNVEFTELELARNKSAIGVPLFMPSPLGPAVGETGDEKEVLPRAGVLSTWAAGTVTGGSLQLARLQLRQVIVLPVPLQRFDELLVPDQRLLTVTVPLDVTRI